MNTISELCGGCDEPVLCCCARIDLGFFSLFHCVIRWPALCHYRAQAWVEAAGEQGSALSLKDPPPHVPLCLFVSPSVCVYLSFCTFICSVSLSLSLSFNANAQMQILSQASGLKFYAMPLPLCFLVASC